MAHGVWPPLRVETCLVETLLGPINDTFHICFRYPVGVWATGRSGVVRVTVVSRSANELGALVTVEALDLSSPEEVPESFSSICRRFGEGRVTIGPLGAAVMQHYPVFFTFQPPGLPGVADYVVPARVLPKLAFERRIM